jgi:predicted O-methyltransferase YrrM
VAIVPQSLRQLAPAALRDEPRLRALAVGFGLIPPRRMHSHEDAAVLAEAAAGARAAVEIGVYEGASAIALLDVLDAGSELHLVDPFGRHPDALPGGWGATEWATRRAVRRRARRLAGRAPSVHWHASTSERVAAAWDRAEQVDLVFIDGDHSETGCALDWRAWSPLVAPGGHVVFHDARDGIADGRGLPGPTAVVDRHLRGDGEPGWRIVAEADRTVVARRAPGG